MGLNYEFEKFSIGFISPFILPTNGEINGGITDIELKLFSALKEHSRLTNTEIAKILNKSERTISRLLSTLKNKKLIERVGSNKTGYWKVL